MPKLETVVKILVTSLITIVPGLFCHSSFVIRHY